MSAFPRTVKKTNRVFLNKNWNRGLTVLLCGSPLYVGLYGEWRGWWKKFDPPAPGSSEATFLEIMREDLKAQKFLTRNIDIGDSSVSSITTFKKDYERLDMDADMKDYVKTREKNDGIVFTSTLKDKDPELYKSSGSSEPVSTTTPTSSHNQQNIQNQKTENPPIQNTENTPNQ